MGTKFCLPYNVKLTLRLQTQTIDGLFKHFLFLVIYFPVLFVSSINLLAFYCECLSLRAMQLTIYSVVVSE